MRNFRSTSTISKLRVLCLAIFRVLSKPYENMRFLLVNVTLPYSSHYVTMGRELSFREMLVAHPIIR